MLIATQNERWRYSYLKTSLRKEMSTDGYMDVKRCSTCKDVLRKPFTLSFFLFIACGLISSRLCWTILAFVVTFVACTAHHLLCGLV